MQLIATAQTHPLAPHPRAYASTQSFESKFSGNSTSLRSSVQVSIAPRGHVKLMKDASMKRMLINATQAEERRWPLSTDKNSSTTKSKSKGANSARAISTRPSSPASSPRWKPVLSTTAKTATAFCRSRKSRACTSRKACPPPRPASRTPSAKARNCWSRSKKKSVATRAQP
jgi:hypothetical protein